MPKLNDGRNFAIVTANKTLTAADQGTVQLVQADGVVITLPATANLSFVVRNGGLPKTGGPVGSGDDNSVGFTVKPASGDGITGLGFTAQANKGAVNTKATAMVNDELHVLGTGAAGAGAWNVNRATGTWAREA